MPKRCYDPLCANLIKQGREHWVDNKPFCDEECATNWQQQGDLFERAADPHHTPFKREPPRRMNGG